MDARKEDAIRLQQLNDYLDSQPDAEDVAQMALRKVREYLAEGPEGMEDLIDLVEDDLPCADALEAIHDLHDRGEVEFELPDDPDDYPVVSLTQNRRGR